MPNNPPRPTELYTRVPDGSTLSLRVGPSEAPFTSQAKFFASGQPSKKWLDAAIRPGPKTAVLHAGSAYYLSVWLAFLGKTTAEIEVTIQQPDGGTHSTPIRWSVPGEQGDVAVRGLFIQMA